MKFSIIKHKKTFQISLLCIIASIIFISFNNPFVYENSDDVYILKIKREFKNIHNLSSLTYSLHDGYLYATTNKPAKVLKITKGGVIVQVRDIPFIKDAESIEYLTNDLFIAVDEETSILYVITITKDMDIEIKSTIQLDIFDGKKNRGFEGLGWQKDTKTLFAAKERKPAKIFTYKLDINTASVKNKEKQELDVNLADISGLDVYKNNLRVLSDESKLLINLELLTNKKNTILNLRKGHHNLQEDVPQPEGVTTTPNGDIYIVSEPNLFYVFTKEFCDKKIK